ncbi:hypothetical protein DEU56DRAFT_762164 [Suillus clintonianus]|uniref:uncharacterized protein n=1 Tax=Suillus clintonianus TaxID=1904413 RepID=UPI001B866E3E|nr:uncharacterized protein DEU56DRAFT_762164 [Suillus clintonianus]KAG2111489.1 hypothetical protein DEU56DRAFT_762164 [Suillus clintonianus]
MGRPKLYNTPEERQEAKRMHRRTHYASQEQSCNQCETQSESIGKTKKHELPQSSPQKKLTEVIHSDINHHMIDPYDNQGSQHVHLPPENKVRQQKGSLIKVIDALVRNHLETGDLDGLRGTLSALEVIVEELHDTEQHILGREGMSPKFLKASDASKEAKEVIRAVEDVFCCALVSGMDLHQRYADKKFIFQTLWDTKLNFFESLLINFPPHTHISAITIMAPRKWTSPEQDEWLAPWYDKYRAKQTEKNKNWPNFFADLNETWFIAYPEQRPASLPPVGPLTQDEMLVMHKACDERKEKLRNRFKNSLGTTKAGRQAKADATDVFKVVLRSVAESEKPTRSLQEVEAYSKLYYHTRIKATADEVLKAEAELLQAENKTLTNGKRIAIVKQHTASLYSGETDEVKAEVQRYIENQKTRTQKDNEAGTWSEDDYARNIEKLAAIANKFLKGLAEATGFTFSLLAGGPSPESSGSIDVYRHVHYFHVGHTKFGNDFSKAYPEFETGIMSPFRDHLYRVYPDLVDSRAHLGSPASLNEGPTSLNELEGPASLNESPVLLWNEIEIGRGLEDVSQRRSDISSDGNHSALSGMKDADKSGQTFSNTSGSTTSGPDTNLPFDSAQQSSLDFSENLTGDWNLDDTFWTDLAAKVAAFEVSGGDNPALPHLPPYPHAESTSSPTPQSPDVPAPLPHIPHTICHTSPATSSHMVPASPEVPVQAAQFPLPASPEVPVQAAQFPHHDSQPASPMEPRLQPSPPPISTLPGLPSNTPVIAKTTTQPLPHQSNALSTSGVEPSPDGNEHCHRRRTGRVSIPSKRNAAANSIGENALTVSGKHATAREPRNKSVISY